MEGAEARSEAAAQYAEHGSVLQPYRWIRDEWLPATLEATTTNPTGIRLATFNILADHSPWFIELAIASSERFGALCTEVERLDATILALNEVSQNSLAALLASPFVQANYFVTELPDNRNRSVQPHGCVILSKLPFAECYSLDLDGITNPSSKRAVVGVFAFQEQRFAVCSMHTTAYETQETKMLRAKQIAQAHTFVQSLDADGGHFILGDLNLHYLSEDGVAPDNCLLDLWAETHFCSSGDGNAGYTFDAHTNAMIGRYIPAEARRMRLDRILCSEKCILSPVKPVEIWGDVAVDVPRDVFLSDHYGLTVDLAQVPCCITGDTAVGQILRENAISPDIQKTSSMFSFLLALMSHVPWLARRYFFG